MNQLPLMRRGLSPEGRKIRERHQGSLTIGIQGITVHPTERSRSRRDFLQENVKRLHEIQTLCKERDGSKRSQPLRATRDSSASTTSSLRQAAPLLALRNGSPKLNRRNPSPDREGSAHSDYFSLVEEQIEPLTSNQNDDLSVPQDDLDRPDSCIINSRLNNTNESRIDDCREASNDNQSRSASSLSQSQPFSPTRFNSLPTQHQRSPSPSRLKPLSHRPTKTSVSTIAPVLRQDVADQEELHSDRNLGQGLRQLRMNSLMSRIKSQKPACEIDYNTHYKAIENQHRMLLDNTDVLSLYGSGDGSLQNEEDSHRSTKKVHPGNPKLLRARSFDRELTNKKNSGGNKLNRVDSARKKKGKNVSQPTPPLLRKNLSKSVSNLGCVNPELKSRTHEYSLSKTVNGIHKPEINAKRNVNHDQENARVMLNESERTKSNVEDSSRFASSVRQKKEDDRESKEANADVDLNNTFSSSCDLNFDVNEQSYDSRPQDLHLSIHSESQSDAGQNQHQENLNKSVSENQLHGHSLDDIQIGYDHTDPEETSTPVPKIQPYNDSHKIKKRENAAMNRPTLRRSQSLKNIKQPQPGDPPPSYQKGKLPRYLMARKEEKRRLEEIAKSVDPECPPGHAPLPEYERRNTLHLLRKSQAEVMRDLSSLPVAQDTLRVKKKRHDLEEKLMQIEDGLRIFSQPKVYVVNDE